MHVESPQKTPSVSAGGGVKFNTENEAILVKGSSDESPQGKGFSLDPEVQESSAEFNLNIEEQRENSRFKFGERMTAVDREESAAGAGEEAFPDVDLKALERELLGGGAPEVEKIDLSIDHGKALEEDVNPARVELQKAQEGLADRIKKYAQIVADVTVSPKSTVTRVEARRRQKELMADVGKENIKELDELRREFTKALFKK